MLSLVTVGIETVASQDRNGPPAMNGAVEAQRNPAPAKNQRYWETHWSFKDVDIGKLAKRLESIGIELGLELKGSASVEFDVGVPLTSLRDGAAYRFDGTLNSRQLSVDGMQLQDLAVALIYRDGVAKLTRLKAAVVSRPEEEAGRIEGEATMELLPQGDLTARLDVDRLSLAPVTEIVSKYLQSATVSRLNDGRMSGEVQFRTPLNALGNLATYNLSGRLSANGLQVSDLPPATLEIPKVEIAAGKLLIDSFQLVALSTKSRSQVELFGSAELPLDATGDFRFALAGDDIRVGTVLGMLNESGGEQNLLTGKIDFRAQGTGTLESSLAKTKWDIDAAIASPSLSAFGVNLGVIEHDINITPNQLSVQPRRKLEQLPDTFQLEQLTMDYAISEQAFTLTNLNANLFGGTVQGTARIPLKPAGEFVSDLRFAELRPVYTVPNAGRLLPTIAASFSGQLRWRFPVEDADQPLAHSGEGVFRAERIHLGNESIGELDAKLSADRGQFDLQGSGTLFGGAVEIVTAASMDPTDTWRDVPKRVRAAELEFDGVALESLLLSAQLDQVPISGRASGAIAFPDLARSIADRRVLPDAEIEISLRDVSHARRLLTRSAKMIGRLENGIFVIGSLTGDYAEGSVRSNGRIYLLGSQGQIQPRFDLQASASQVNLRNGLAFLGELAEQAEGRVAGSVSLAGTFEALRVRGNVEGRELKYFGVPLGVAHSDLIAEANVATKKWSIRFPTIKSNVSGGRIEGQCKLSSSTRRRQSVDLETRWQMNRVDLFQLLNRAGQSTSLASGEFTGRLTLTGKSVESVDDLAGKFQFSLGDTRGAAVPGLLNVGRYLGPVSLVTETFDVGEAKGTIGGGALIMEDFWLGSDAALVKADGKFYLRSGRLDVNALIATGDYSDIAVNFAQLAKKYALQSLLPSSAVLSISDLLRDRTLVVRVLGTAQDPIVRLQTIETFREEAARFLLREGQRVILAGLTAGATSSLSN